MDTGLLKCASACHTRLCRLGTTQSSQLGGKARAVLVEFICSEKAPFSNLYKGLQVQDTTAPSPDTSEDLIHLPQGSLQHHNVLSPRCQEPCGGDSSCTRVSRHMSYSGHSGIPSAHLPN